MTELGTHTAVIRRAGPADARALARLRYEFRAELGPPSESAETFEARCTAWMTQRLGSESSWICWIAAERAELVGQIWLQLIEKLPNPVGEPEVHAYISSLHVVPERRGRRIGTSLLAAALAWCRHRGDVHAVVLWPTPASRSLYERHGFAVRDDVMELLLWGAASDGSGDAS
ncbi:MAG: GNAT family N-acetyltransferase [Gemmatimonadetes bacterium]|nr:GNAT family N-acetyltransferase [Gemmatimonadota bacterium]